MEDTENAVPEITAANPDGGAESLNADPVTSDIHETLDSLLDEAEQETNPETQTQDETSVNENTSNDIQHSSAESTEETDSSPSEGLVQDPPADATDDAGRGQESKIQQAEIDPEIAAIEQPRNLSEKNQNNWRKLQETASLYKKQAEEAETLRQRLAEAESRPSETPPDYEELRKFRQIFDIKNDPDFQSRYTTPINSAKDTIYGIMKKHGATDEVIQSIEKAGGPDKIDDKWWQQNALEKLPLTDAERLKRSLVDVVDLKDKQEKEIEFVAAHAEELMEAKRNHTVNWYNEESQEVYKSVDALTKDIPWARYQEVPANATEEQIAKIQKHNESVAVLDKQFQAAVWPKTADERAKVAAAAAFSHVLTDQLRYEQKTRADMDAQIKKLVDENSKLKSAYKMPKQNISTPSTIKNNTLNDRIKMNASDAIDLGLDEAGI